MAPAPELGEGLPRESKARGLIDPERLRADPEETETCPQHHHHEQREQRGSANGSRRLDSGLSWVGYVNHRTIIADLRVVLRFTLTAFRAGPSLVGYRPREGMSY